MIRLRIHFIAVPGETWLNYPRDRSFAELHKDAEGAARRFLKGVNTQIEGRRVSQTCNFIEDSALNVWRARPSDSRAAISAAVVFDVSETDSPATAMIDMLKRGWMEAKSTEKIGSAPKSLIPSIRAPGSQVADLAAEVEERSASASNESIQRAFDLVRSFLNEAIKANAAIVQVVSVEH